MGRTAWQIRRLCGSIRRTACRWGSCSSWASCRRNVRKFRVMGVVGVMPIRWCMRWVFGELAVRWGRWGGFYCLLIVIWREFSFFDPRSSRRDSFVSPFGSIARTWVWLRCPRSCRRIRNRWMWPAIMWVWKYSELVVTSWRTYSVHSVILFNTYTSLVS